jgi:hypothetical protein
MKNRRGRWLREEQRDPMSGEADVGGSDSVYMYGEWSAEYIHTYTCEGGVVAVNS